MEEAYNKVDDRIVESLEKAWDNILRYHREQLPRYQWLVEIEPGAYAGQPGDPLIGLEYMFPEERHRIPPQH
ncbi:MAG: histidinol dehydrogenase [Desulfurococcales archaeon]|nr:histidinol dehydrogenase [Desulfurococcales archaeon]